MYHQGIISASPVHHQCIIRASSGHHQCIINAWSAHHLGILRVSSGPHQSIIRASSEHHQGLIRASSGHHQCIISALSVLYQASPAHYQRIMCTSFLPRVLHCLLCLVLYSYQHLFVKIIPSLLVLFNWSTKIGAIYAFFLGWNWVWGFCSV